MQYPDRFDEIALAFNHLNEPWPGYWKTSEASAFRKILSSLNEKKYKRALDIGCGRGRMLCSLSRFSGDVLGVEPDPWRWRAACEIKHRYRLNNVDVLNCSAFEIPSDLLQGGFDLIILWHVVGHLSINSANQLFRKVSDILRDDGRIIMSFPFAGLLQSQVYAASMEEGRLLVSRLEHDAGESMLQSESNEALICRVFSDKVINKLLKDRLKILSVVDFNWRFRSTFLDKIFRRDEFMKRALLRCLPFQRDRAIVLSKSAAA